MREGRRRREREVGDRCVVLGSMSGVILMGVSPPPPLFPITKARVFSFFCVCVIISVTFRDELASRLILLLYDCRLLSQHAEEARAGAVDVFRRFRQGREEREMPGFERGNWCFALRVYWREENRRGGGDGGEGEGKVEEIVRGLEGQRL